MNEMEQLTQFLENLSTGAISIGAVFVGVIGFAAFMFVRMMSRSINTNLEVVKQLSRDNMGHEARRYETQTNLDDISRRLLDASIQLERQKTRAESLESEVRGYKTQCSQTIEAIMKQVDNHTEREKVLQARLDKLSDHNAQLVAQNTELIQHIKSQEAMYQTTIKDYQIQINVLKQHVEKLTAERALFELNTAKTVSRLETQLNILQSMENEHHGNNQRNHKNDVKQDIGGSILDSSPDNNSE